MNLDFMDSWLVTVWSSAGFYVKENFYYICTKLQNLLLLDAPTPFPKSVKQQTRKLRNRMISLQSKFGWVKYLTKIYSYFICYIWIVRTNSCWWGPDRMTVRLCACCLKDPDLHFLCTWKPHRHPKHRHLSTSIYVTFILSLTQYKSTNSSVSCTPSLVNIFLFV